MMIFNTRNAGSLKLLLGLLVIAPIYAFQPSMFGGDHGIAGQKYVSTRTSQHIRYPCNAPLYSVMANIESQAAIAADTWSVESTPFMEPDVAVKVEEQFQGRGDVIAFRVAGGRRLLPEGGSTDVSPGEGRRSRFVIMHPDLGLDIATAESEYCSVIRVDNVDVAGSNTFPNALASIGVHLENVGDIVVEDSSTVYLVVDPSVEKQCLRLLSKELVGVGINLSVCGDSEFMPKGEVQDMKLSKILERQMERKKLEQGFVQFG
mmetsp:Transcript_2535/g.3881  ORF Transcript_2535/g.3881 Transcript_2535/m.3881 type:complete len:262 (-) Transcript_2535:54-839(-)|eukprot:CAMPEP_0196138814 /NCGR_PEP_ID=MMETSP0910-20130528/6316_1 /TAXON_ID=49265 /ORGANISM="Thalassiosira rotula, Strain GSO102" /LENGTH=261 /DNA_ID=CAMNT_0041399467 /DNA_START=152 /DNA_END=937 /DNA_ORIENTATION=-